MGHFTPTTRRTLLAKVNAGDTVGWEEFYHTYKNFIAYIARNTPNRDRSGCCCLDDEEVADLIQLVMVSIFKGGCLGYDSARGTRFRTWLGQVVRNNLHDILRRKYRNVPANSLSSDGKDGEGPARDIPEDVFDEVWEAEWRHSVCREAMVKLRSEVKARSYRAFELHVIQDLSVEEAAKITGMTINGFYVCKYRCIERLRRIVGEIQDEGRI